MSCCLSLLNIFRTLLTVVKRATKCRGLDNFKATVIELRWHKLENPGTFIMYTVHYTLVYSLYNIRFCKGFSTLTRKKSFLLKGKCWSWQAAAAAVTHSSLLDYFFRLPIMKENWLAVVFRLHFANLRQQQQKTSERRQCWKSAPLWQLHAAYAAPATAACKSHLWPKEMLVLNMI